MRKIMNVPDKERPWLVVICRARLWPNASGLTQRIRSLLTYLRRDFRVCLYNETYFRPCHDENDTDFFDCYVHKSWLSRFFRAPIFGKILAYYYGQKAGGIDLWRKAGIAPPVDLIRWAKDKSIPVVMAVYARTMPTAKYFSRWKNATLVLDTIDIEHLRVDSARKMKMETGMGQMSKEAEIQVWKSADLVMAIQQEEADLIKSYLESKPVVLVPHAFEDQRNESDIQDKNVDSNRVLFVGSQAKPNIHGLRSFLKDVWPGVLQAIPGAVLDIVGDCGEKIESSELPKNVFRHGRQPDLSPFYKQASLVINPVQYGSGLKIKCVEAMMYGKCMLTTPVGVQGLASLAGDALVVEEIDQYSKRLIELLRDPGYRKKVEVRARRAYLQEFSPSACYENFIHLLQPYLQNSNDKTKT